jgi:cobalt-zinc-cadmium efflux system outer membrane protein
MKTLPWPLGLAALLLSPLVASAQPAATEQTRLTLDRAQELAATHSPELSSARHEVDATSGGVVQASARRNPELTTTVEDFRSRTRTTTATIGIPLELGGKRSARIAAAERAHDVAAAQLANTKAKVRAQVVARFFGVMAAQERLRLANDSAKLAAKAADVVIRRVDAGKVSPVDATRAKVDAANAQLEVAEAQSEVKAARQTLAALWGEWPPRFGDVDGDLGGVPASASSVELMRDLEDAPSLRATRLEIDSRKALVDVERSRTIPDVVVSVGAKRDNELGLTQAVVGISVPLPLFDHNQGAVHEASKRAEKAQDEYEAARVQLLADLSQATAQLSTAQASLAVLRDTVLPAAQQAYDASTTGFEAGKFGFLDVIDAQRSLLQARSRYLNTLVAAYQASTTIDRLLGR